MAAVFFAALPAASRSAAEVFQAQVQAEVQVADVQLIREKIVEVAVDKTIDKTSEEDNVDAEFPGAGLKTDPELETFLKKAEIFVKEGRYDLATILWQRVLNESGETVMTRPDWTVRSFDRKYRRYKSVSAEVERTIARLPAGGLRQYRLSADGEAQALLAAAEQTGREQALANIVRTYFMSSLGDDAAFELACLRLDRHDFVGGARLLAHVLNNYPDSNIPRGELLARLAFANARLGDREAAQANLDSLVDSAQADAFEQLAALVKTEIDDGTNQVAALSEADAWPMAWGGPQRLGHMPALPKEVTAATLSEAWFEKFEIDNGAFRAASVQPNNGIIMGGGVFFGRLIASNGRVSTATTPVSRDQLVAKWRSSGWMPAGQMLIADGMVYYKRHERVVCRDAETGKVKWMSRPSVYQPPALSAWLIQMQRSYGMNNMSQNQPTGPLESFLFGDRLNQAMLISDGLLYTIDGPLDGEPIPTPTTAQRGFNYRNVPRRTRTNVLCAYDARNGKFKWMRAADGGDEGSKFDIGYMAAPVPYAKFLLVPVSDNGTLWLHAVDKSNGELVWRSFLCEDPNNGASPWSPIGLAVDGGDAYVATGGGVVIALDAMSGAVRWASRYQRSTKGGMNMARFGAPQTTIQGMDGWEEDIVVPNGRALVVIATDSDKLFALDRRTGDLLWESPRQPTGDDDAGVYFLGVLGDGLFLSGKRSLRRYDLSKDGRLMWEARFVSPSLGHGVLTSDAIYMPTGESIARINPDNGKIEAQVGVFSPTKEPVGNLYSDGKRLLAVGLARAYALQDLETRMIALRKRVEDGDSEAQLERMRLHLRGNNFDAALSDLRGAHTLRLAEEGPLAANRALYEGIRELDLLTRDPRLTLRMIAEAQVHHQRASEQSNVSKEALADAVAKRDGLIFSALSEIRKNEVPQAADEVLKAAAIVAKPNQVNAARQALLATVTAADAESIQSALGDENENVRVVALAGAAAAFGDKATERLADLLNDNSEEVRFYVAFALLNAGDREALSTLGELLDAEDVRIRSRAVQSLRAVSGQRFKYMAYEKDDARKAAADAWRDWIAADGQTSELKLPIGDSNVLLGRTLVAMYSQNRIVEYDSNRKKVWEKTGINQPWGAEGLPNGNRLICSYNGRFVVELDPEGKEVWRIDGLPGNCSHAHRLDNGNTLVVSSNANMVWEYSPEKKIVWQKQVVGNPQDARRLENGNTLVALQSGNKVVEIDRDGKEVWTMPDMKGAFAARRLDNGNTLVALSRTGEAVEVTPEKEIIWRHSGLSSPYDAQRLDNGNTLITDTRGFREVDPSGKVVWQENVSGVLRIHRY